MSKNIIRNKSFILFLLSQGISNFGDAFQLIAAVSILRRVTGSGLSAAFGLVCTPLLSILFSTLAGYISDIKNERFLLVLIDILRGLVVILFISRESVLQIYLLIIALSTLDILYNPPRRKLLPRILESNGLISANSLLNGISGAMFIMGPVLAGSVIISFGTDAAFLVNSASFFISALLIAVIRPEKEVEKNVYKDIASAANTLDSLYRGITYCLNTYAIRKIIFLGTVICFCTTSVNIAFYPFAFDILKITDKTWGFMMSIFYGASLLAMPVTLMVKIKAGTFYKLFIPASLIIISLIWYSYGNTYSLNFIMALQLLEGTIFAFVNIILTSHLQTKSNKEYLGRVTGINDFINNFGKILGIGITYLLLTITVPGRVFVLCSAVISAYAVYTLFTVSRKKLRLHDLA